MPGVNSSSCICIEWDFHSWCPCCSTEPCNAGGCINSPPNSLDKWLTRAKRRCCGGYITVSYLLLVTPYPGWYFDIYSDLFHFAVRMTHLCQLPAGGTSGPSLWRVILLHWSVVWNNYWSQLGIHLKVQSCSCCQCTWRSL